MKSRAINVVSGYCFLIHSCDQCLKCKFELLRKMDKIDNAIEFLNNLIHSIVDGIANINKDNIFDIQSYLHNAQEKIKFLKLESEP